ncbi:MAG: DUF309 domain-containing protein [Pirellulales bacterium]
MTDTAGININKASSPRYAPAFELPPYSYVPGHDLPHPVKDPAGHLYAVREQAHGLPTDAVMLSANTQWLCALDLFNGGFYWEAHETWEGFWHGFGRKSPEAQFVQGLIHLAAAAVKIREGKPVGVARHTRRARELFGDMESAPGGGTLGLLPESIAAVVAELEGYIPACWHTARTPYVRVLAENLRLAG